MSDRIIKAAARVEGKYHDFSVKGGPLAFNLELSLDGKPLRGVRAFELKADVNDIIRLKLELFVQADLSLSIPEEGISAGFEPIDAVDTQ
jgi:hypothetical protein